VGYGWITSRRPAESIRLHHEMVGHVLEEAGRELAIPAQRRVLLGFSQSVSLNYRFAAAHPDSVRGVAAICGALPGDWDDARPIPLRPAVLHIARSDDEFYPTERTEQYARRLRLRCDDVEFQLLPGGHRFPSRAGPVWESWVNRILPLEL
jgi:predicted esterase